MTETVLCDVFATANSTLVDEEIYACWLDGLSPEEAFAALIKKNFASSYYDDECVMSEINDSYRLFCLLERYLDFPTKLRDQCHLSLDSETRAMLIENYYALDDTFVREILGKKLSSKTRKDLDDVSEKTKIRLKSCRRQFDNFRCIFKTVEDMKGSLVNNIQSNFLLSEPLAKKYAASVFITNNRFETGKKRLQYLSFDDFVFCAHQMMLHWSYSSVDSRQDDMDVDVDREFLQNLREFKLLLEREHIDDLRAQIVKKLNNCISDKVKSDLDLNFRTMFRVLVNIAVDLNHSRDLRDFFVDVVEKFIEPCKATKWSAADVEKFLLVTSEAVKKFNPIRKHQPPLISTWERYMKVASVSIIRMYHL